MKKFRIFKALFAASALALALPSCSDLSTNETSSLVSEEGKVAVSFSVSEGYRSIISSLPEDLTYSLEISSEGAVVVAKDNIALSSIPAVYLDAGKAYSFTINGKKGETLVLSGTTTKEISANDANVSITLKAVTGAEVSVELQVKVTSGNYGLSTVKATVYSDANCTTATEEALVAEVAKDSEGADIADTYTLSGKVKSGESKWLKIELLNASNDVIGSKTEVLYTIAESDISATTNVAIKKYRANLKLTSATKPAKLVLKNTSVTNLEYTGIDLTAKISENAPYTVSELIPVGSYGIYADGSADSCGTVAGADEVSVNTAAVLKSIVAKWTAGEGEDPTETQPTLYAGLSAEDLLKKITIVETYSDNSTKDVASPDATVTGYNADSTESQTVKLTYNGKEAEITVQLTALALESIAINESSSFKTEYTVGDELDLTGLVLSLTYNDTSKNTTVAYSADNAGEFGASGFDSTNPVESQTVTITYGGKEATFEVVIKKAFIENKMYLVTAGNSDVKITLDETENSATLGSYVLSGFNKQNDVIVFNQNLMDENVTSAKISAVVNWKSASGHIGLGLLNLSDSLYTGTKIVSNAGIFATAQGIKGWGSSGLFSKNESSTNASTNVDYLIVIEYEKTETGFTLKFTSDGENGTSVTFTESNFTFPSGKPVYFAVGASPTGTSNPKSDNIVYRDVNLTLSGNGIEKSGEEQTITSVEKTLLTDPRTSLTASTSEVSYTIPSTVTNSNKGDSYKITLANVSLESVKALDGENEVAGAWAWDSTDVTLATGASSVKAKATFTPTDTASYKSIVSKEFTINVTDERAEKPENAKVDVTWNFADMSGLSVYTTATPDTENNKVTYSRNDTSATKHYFVSTSPSMALAIDGTYRDNDNSVQIGAGSFIYVPVSAGSELTITGFSGYTNYTVTLADGKTENVTDASAKTYTAKTAGFAKIEGGANGYIVSIAVKDITRADIVAFYGSEASHIATFPTADEPTISISGDDSVTLAGEGEEAATIQLTATVTNADGATVVWSSSDDTIAKVDQTTGKVTAVAEGEVTITAKITVDEKEYSNSKTVTVNKGGSVEQFEETFQNYKIGSSSDWTQNSSTAITSFSDSVTFKESGAIATKGFLKEIKIDSKSFGDTYGTVKGRIQVAQTSSDSDKLTLSVKGACKILVGILVNGTSERGFQISATNGTVEAKSSTWVAKNKNDSGTGTISTSEDKKTAYAGAKTNDYYVLEFAYEGNGDDLILRPSKSATWAKAGGAFYTYFIYVKE